VFTTKSESRMLFSEGFCWLIKGLFVLYRDNRPVSCIKLANNKLLRALKMNYFYQNVLFHKKSPLSVM
jgi:hypothetical protein